MVESTSCLALTCRFLALWSDEADGSLGKSLEELAECASAFAGACGLEHSRRCGLLRIHVSGDDRLELSDRRELELNPLVLAELKRLKAPPDDFQGFMARMTPLTLNSDWAEPERLTKDD